MAISRVQFKSNTGTSVTSLAITPDSAPTNGNLMVLTIAYNSGTSNRVSSITQTNATWSRAVQKNSTGFAISSDIWYSENAASAGGTVTINLASAVNIAATYVEYSGILTSSSLDQVGSNEGDSTNFGSGMQTGTTPTTTKSEELCIGCVCIDVESDTTSPTNSFTEVTERAAGTPNLTVLERLVSLKNQYGTAVTFDGDFPDTWASTGAIATFKGTAPDFDPKKSSMFLTMT